MRERRFSSPVFAFPTDCSQRKGFEIVHYDAELVLHFAMENVYRFVIYPLESSADFFLYLGINLVSRRS